MKKAIILVIALVMFASSVFAETVTVKKEYSYQASEADSKLSSRGMALEQLKRLLLEEIGTMVLSETEVVNFALTKDKIVVFTGGVVSIEILSEKWDGTTYQMVAKVSADPKDVARAIAKLMENKNQVKELEETRRLADKYLLEKEELEKRLEAEKKKPGGGDYDRLVNEVVEKQRAGEKLLALATEAAKIYGKEAERDRYRAEAEKYLGETTVEAALPKTKYFEGGESDYKDYDLGEFKAGEQTPFWIYMQYGRTYNIRFLASNRMFKLVEEDGNVINVWESGGKSFDSTKKFKVVAVEPVGVTMRVK